MTSPAYRALLPAIFSVFAFASPLLTVPAAQAAEFAHQGFYVEGEVPKEWHTQVQVLDQKGRLLDSMPLYAGDDRTLGADTLAVTDAAVWQVRMISGDKELVSEPQPFQSQEYVKLELPDGMGQLALQPVDVSLSAHEEGEFLRVDFDLVTPKGEHFPLDPQHVQWQLPFGPDELQPWLKLPPDCKNAPSCLYLPLKPRPIVNACFRQLCAGTPGTPPAPAGFKTITAGLHHTCGLTHTGQVLCWGDDRWDQLGSTAIHQCPQTGACSQRPVEIDCIPGSTCRYVAVDAGDYHTCAVDTAGRVWCWGYSDQQQAGDCVDRQCAQPKAMDALNPENAGGVAQFAAVSAGSAHTCAVTRLGSVMCWGDSQYGQAGDQTQLLNNGPLLLGPTANYTAVSAGFDHSCAVTKTAGLECWGNTVQQRQLPAYNPFFGVPIDVLGLHSALPAPVDRVSAGFARTCAHATDGTLSCLDEAFNTQDVMAAATALTDLDISATRFGPHRDVCVADAGNLLCHLHSGGTRSPSAGKDFTDVAVGGDHFCGIAGDGSAWCWGFNDAGQLGDGTVNKSGDFDPVRVLYP